MVKYGYPAPVINGKHKSAHRHQRHKTDRLYRNRFAARVGAGDNYRVKIRAETDIDRHDLVFVYQRVSCTPKLDYALVIQLRNACPHRIGKLSLCKNEVQLDRTFIAAFDRICEAADIRRKLGKNPVDLVLLLVFEELYLVIRLNDRHRLDKNRCAARRGVMHKTRHFSPVFIPDRDNISAVSHGYNIILKIF